MRIGYLPVDLSCSGIDIINEIAAKGGDEVAPYVILEVIWDLKVD